MLTSLNDSWLSEIEFALPQFNSPLADSTLRSLCGTYLERTNVSGGGESSQEQFGIVSLPEPGHGRTGRARRLF